MSRSSTTFVLGAGFSAAEEFPLVRGLRSRVLHFLEAERHSAYGTFLEPGNGGFEDGQFYTGLKRIDPRGEVEFEELLIALSKRPATADSADDPGFIVDRVLRIGCSRLLWSIQNSIWRVSPCYLNFAARLRSTPCDAVVSFNWDLLAEKTLTDAKILWLQRHRSWRPRAQASRVYQLERASAGTASCGVWRLAATGAGQPTLLRYLPSSFEPQQAGEQLRPPLQDLPGDPDLPSADSDVGWLWKQVELAISSRDSLVFIGYSLPDYDSFASDSFRRVAVGKTVEAYTPSAVHLDRYGALFGASALLRQEKFGACQYAATPSSLNFAEIRD